MTLVEPLDTYLAPRTMRAVAATGKSPVVAAAQTAIKAGLAPDSIVGNSQNGMGGQFAPPAPAPVVQPPPVNPATANNTKNDYSADPFLQQEIGGLQAQLQSQFANLTAQQKSELLKFGDPELAKKLLGLSAEDPFIRSISSDPDTSFSTLAQLARAYRDNSGRFNEGENNNNLWYSGHRVKGLGELAYQNNKGVAGATQTMQGNLAKIEQARVQAQQSYDAAALAAEEGAYQRALQFQPADLSDTTPDTKGLADLTNYWLGLGAPTTVKRAGGAIAKAPPGYGSYLVKALKASSTVKAKPVSGGFFLGGRGGRL